jgi:hypothetical protein
MTKQYLAVWYKGGITRKKQKAKFIVSLRDEGIHFSLRTFVTFKRCKANSLGLLFIEDNTIIGAALWQSVGVGKVWEGDTIEMSPVEDLV